MAIVEITDVKLLEQVSGGDAAATRQPGQNSWGENPGPSDGPSEFYCFINNIYAGLTGKQLEYGDQCLN